LEGKASKEMEILNHWHKLPSKEMNMNEGN